MQKFALFALLAAAHSATLAAESGKSDGSVGPQPLTLAQALVLALEKSPRLEAARRGAAVAVAARFEAQAARLPTVDLNVSGRFQGPTATVVPQGAGAPPPSALPGEGVIAPDRALEPQLKLLAPLFSGGALAANQRGAQKRELAARLRVAAEGQSLVVEVTNAYLDALEFARRERLAGAVRELAEERLRVAKIRLGAGTTLAVAVADAEADLAQALQGETETRARLEIAGATLNTLIGRPADAPLVLAELPETQPAHELLAAKSGPPARDRLLALGMERADLRALREEVAQAAAQVDAARAARAPQIGLSGNYLRRLPETLLGNYAWSFGASLISSLFDGGRVKARLAAARFEQQRRAAQLSEAERKLDEQAEQARLALDVAERKLAAEDRKVAARLQLIDVTRARFKAGAAIPAEVAEAETALARAQTDAVTARFEAARARVRLLAAVGQASPETVVKLAVMRSN